MQPLLIVYFFISLFALVSGLRMRPPDWNPNDPLYGARAAGRLAAILGGGVGVVGCIVKGIIHIANNAR